MHLSVPVLLATVTFISTVARGTSLLRLRPFHLAVLTWPCPGTHSCLSQTDSHRSSILG
jgi:hypothetical protein